MPGALAINAPRIRRRAIVLSRPVKTHCLLRIQTGKNVSAYKCFRLRTMCGALNRIAHMRPNCDQTPKWGVARIVGVAWEARQSNFAYTAQGLRRYRGRLGLTRVTLIGSGCWPRSCKEKGRRQLIRLIASVPFRSVSFSPPPFARRLTASYGAIPSRSAMHHLSDNRSSSSRSSPRI